jgi:hypothetical protein
MDNYILNPKTKRLVKKGGKAYYKLVNEGILKEEEKYDNTATNNIICNTRGMSTEEIDKIRKDFNVYNPDYSAIQGRGNLNDFLMKRKRGTSREERIKQLANRVARVIKEDNDRLDIYLENNKDLGLSDYVKDIIISEYHKMNSKKTFFINKN